MFFPTFAALDTQTQPVWCGERENSSQTGPGTWAAGATWCFVRLFFHGIHSIAWFAPAALCHRQTWPLLWNYWVIVFQTRGNICEINECEAWNQRDLDNVRRATWLQRFPFCALESATKNWDFPWKITAGYREEHEWTRGVWGSPCLVWVLLGVQIFQIFAEFTDISK